MNARALPLLCAVALALAARPARADEQKGIVLTRQAQAALAAGDAEGALRLLESARTEWPGSAVVANTLGDVHRALGQLEQAVHEYERGMRDGCEHHAHFNRGVSQNELAETALGAAGVPAGVEGLPDGSQPQMLQAITDGLTHLQPAREDFLSALEYQDDRAGRESVGALNRRIDALRAMKDELQKREQQEQEKVDQEDSKDQDPKDQQDQPQDSQDQPKDQGQDQEQEQQDGQDPKEPPQQDPSQDQDQEGQQDQPQDGGTQGQPGEAARELSKEEVQQLLDKLEQLEKQGRLLQKAQQAARHQDVEKDW